MNAQWLQASSPRQNVKSPRRKKYDAPKYSDPILDISVGGNVIRFNESLKNEEKLESKV
jgi:hypothetical protein|tara:strand:+ start:216 stop:392 length:177 start_codon:yes stop_codon:yes gene_type:complete